MRSNLPNLKPGDLVAGRFRIVERVGSGGFSVVYRAHQEDANRFVALKVLKPTASSDEKTVERFRREALYASHLSHPHTITLFDYGHTDDGLCYIAMEFLKGFDLSFEVQKQKPMDLKRVWKILVQTSRSLAEAHRLGLVHRDLKPENIFLCQREEGEYVKVLDFGVSKAISQFGDAGPATLAPLTQEGTVFGTPLYMAPEQAMAETITPAVDVYAMGHIAYEMITGVAAYDGSSSAMDVMLRQINDPPLALPEPWDTTPFSDLITRCTQKDPAWRIQDASALLEALFAPEFEEWMDPAERPRAKTTMPKIPVALPTSGATMPLPALDTLEEVYRWELDVLKNTLQECMSTAEVRLVVIHGKPGTGRTNLMQAFLAEAQKSPDVVIVHRPDENKRSDTSMELEIAELTGLQSTDSGANEVSRLLSLLAGEDEEWRRSMQDLETDSRQLAAMSSMRETLLTRIAEPFRMRASTSTVVWAIENVERVDALTLAFLDRFYRDLQVNPARLMIVVTANLEDLKQRPGLVRYTQSLFHASKPYSRQLFLVPLAAEDPQSAYDSPGPDPLYDDDPPTMESLDGEEDDHTDKISASVVDAGEAFDQVLGYLAQLGDTIPDELYTMLCARVLETDLMRLADTVVHQAERFGILLRQNSDIRFAKRGFADSLRERFEADPSSEAAHLRIAELLESYYSEPTREQLRLIARHRVAGGDPMEAIRMLYGAAEGAYRVFDLDASRELYLQISKIIENIGDQRAFEGVDHREIWMRLGEIHGALGEHGAAEDALHKALRNADLNDAGLRGRASKLLGDLAASQERYQDALKHFEMARDAYRSLGQGRPFVAITGEMGRCALLRGRAVLAEELCRQAIDMAQKLKDRPLLARLHRGLGTVLTRRGRFMEAVEQLERSMHIFESMHRDHDVADCLSELGYARLASGRFEEAREHFTRAIALIAGHVSASSFSAYLGSASAHAALEDLDKSEAVLTTALAQASMNNDFFRMAQLHVYLGDVELARKNFERAQHHYERVIEIGQSVGHVRLWIVALVRLAYVEYGLGKDSLYDRLGEAMEKARESADADSELQIRAHIIYLQLLQHGFRVRGDTFSSLLDASKTAELRRASVLCHLFRADVDMVRGHYEDTRNYLREASALAAQIGDFTLLIPIARREYLIAKTLGDPVDPHLEAGWALGATLPPEVGTRRFEEIPRAAD